MTDDNRAKPQPNLLSQERIPSDLLGLTQWVVWRFVAMPGRKKPTKVPYIPSYPNLKAESNNPSTWSDFQTAYAVLQDQRCDGVGFVFASEDPYTGIDLDQCRNPTTGDLEPWAQEVIENLQSYTEVSPSGTGVHILVRATLPSGGRRKGTIEMYDSVRFFCMTGQHLDGAPLTVESRQAEVETLHAETFSSKQVDASPIAGKTDQGVTGLTDEEVIQKAKAAKNAAKFKSLWDGEWQGSYRSQSEADVALCGILAFWTGHDAEQLDRLFHQSKLIRPKWDERHYGDGTTYGQGVIKQVLGNLTQVYEPQGKGKQGGGGRTPTPADLADGFLTSRGFQAPDGLHLCWHGEEWLKFNGKIFKSIPIHDLRAEVMVYLRRGPARAKATKTLLNNVLANLEAMCLLPHHVALPAQYVDGQWNSSPETLVFENGILDIGKLLKDKKPPQVLPHTPGFVSTVALPFRFDPKARWPQWQNFLERVLPDPECRQLLQEIFGYCLTYDTSLQKFFLFEGTGANGKGVVLNLLAKMLGAENISSLPLELFGASHGLEATLGKLVNITAEIGDMDRVAEGLLKQFTGNDLMHFNPKFRKPFAAKPTAKLIMASNVRPPFRDRSDGLWRRLIILPFPVTISEEERNSQLTDDLAVELPGILNWAIRGAQSLRKERKFLEPEVCLSARKEFKREANPAREYLVENYIEDPNRHVEVGRMYEDYVKQCKDNGGYPMGNTNLGREVKACFPNVKRVRLTTKENKSRPWAYKGVHFSDDAPCPVS